MALDDAPITAERYLSFATRLGDDDMFSSDLSLEERIEKLPQIDIPTLLIVSQDDEFVPDSVDKIELAIQICRALSGGSSVCRTPEIQVGSCCIVSIPEANHYISNYEHHNALFIALEKFLDKVI